MASASSVPNIEGFTVCLREALRKVAAECQAITKGKNERIYVAEDRDDSLYFIESGQVKLLAPVSATKRGLISILADNDIFGESCLLGTAARKETAVAMRDSRLIRVPRSTFVDVLKNEGLMAGMARYMVERIEHQRQLIAALLAVKKQHRLALTLLYLARRFGTKQGAGTCIERRILHSDLAEMTGIRRTRVTLLLLKFRELGMLTIGQDHLLVVDEKEFLAYLERASVGDDFDLPEEERSKYIN